MQCIQLNIGRKRFANHVVILFLFCFTQHPNFIGIGVCTRCLLYFFFYYFFFKVKGSRGFADLSFTFSDWPYTDFISVLYNFQIKLLRAKYCTFLQTTIQMTLQVQPKILHAPTHSFDGQCKLWMAIYYV